MKLIRDRLAQTPSPDNRTVILVNKETHRMLLFDKIVEEAHEISSAKTDEDIVNELADLTEAVLKFMELQGITKDRLERARLEKVARKGGFDGGFALL